MQHVVVDPITRIEGHLRVEVTVDETTGTVTDAISSGTAWRGLELVMKDRTPATLGLTFSAFAASAPQLTRSPLFVRLKTRSELLSRSTQIISAISWRQL